MQTEVIVNVLRDFKEYQAYPWSVVSTAPGWDTIRSSCVDYGGHIFSIGGKYLIEGPDNYVGVNDIWKSSDGVVWSLATSSAFFPQRFGHVSIVFNNTVLVIGGTKWSGSTADALYGSSGLLNDVWQSSDGTNYSFLTVNALWSARQGHSVVVYDDKLWLFGGADSSNFKQDVYNSTDGITWVEVTPAASWAARSGHVSFVLDGKMWVVGGRGVSGTLNDSWYSTDGVLWLEGVPAHSSAREGVSSHFYEDKIFLFGGTSGTSEYSEVSYSSDGVHWARITPLSYPAKTPFSYSRGDTLYVSGTRNSLAIESLSFSDFTIGHPTVFGVHLDPEGDPQENFATYGGVSTHLGDIWDYDGTYGKTNVIRVSHQGVVFLGFTELRGVLRISESVTTAFLVGKTINDLNLHENNVYAATNEGLYFIPEGATSDLQVVKLL
jgi:hypothetical protein